MAEYLRKEQELKGLFQGVNLSGNLASASSAAAAMAQLSATEQNVAAAGSATAVLAQLADAQQNAEGASYAAAAMSQLADTQQNAAAAFSVAAVLGQMNAVEGITEASAAPSCTHTAVVSAKAAAGDDREAAVSQEAAGNSHSKGTLACISTGAEATSATAGSLSELGTVLVKLASRVSEIMQQVLPQLTNNISGSEPAEPANALAANPSALLQQLQVLQQRLPTHQDKASMLQDYQAWLDQIKECLVQQHEATQVCSSAPEHSQAASVLAQVLR